MENLFKTTLRLVLLNTQLLMTNKFYEWWKNHRRVITLGGFLILLGLFISPVIKEAKYKNKCIKLSEKGAFNKFNKENIGASEHSNGTEDDGKGKAEMVSAVKRHLEAEKLDIQMHAAPGSQAEGRAGDGKKHDHLARVVRNEDKPRRHDHHQRAWRQRCQKITHHRSNPRPASRSCEGRSRPRL